MNSFVKNFLATLILSLGLFAFLGNGNVSEAQNTGCQIESASFRPSGIINNYAESNPPNVYLDVRTLGCDGSSDLLKFKLYTIDIQDDVLAEMPIYQTNYFWVNSTVTSSPFASPTIWSNNPEFSIPIKLGEDGPLGNCLPAGGLNLQTEEPPQSFTLGSVNNIFSGLNFYTTGTTNVQDCFLYFKIYKYVGGSPASEQLIYSVGSPANPQLIYHCDGDCNQDFIIPSNICFIADSSLNTNSGLVPYMGNCEVDGSTINVTTINGGSSSGGVMGSIGEYSTTPLAPLPGFTGNPNLGQWLESLFTMLIVIAGILALIMIIVGGITYVTSESFGEKGKGKGYIMNAIAGLVLALGAWVILNTINPNLAEDLNIKIPTVTLDGPTKEWAGGNAAPGTNIAPTALLNGQPIIMGMLWPDDSQQRGQLSAVGISVVSSGNSNCTPTAGTPNCTSVYFDGPASGIIQEIINFKSTCGNCDIVITGGSEAWLHETHGPNKRIVDIRATPSLNTYLNGLPGGPSPSANFPSGQTINIEGVGRFYAEPSGSTGNTTAKHWHVTIY